MKARKTGNRKEFLRYYRNMKKVLLIILSLAILAVVVLVVCNKDWNLNTQGGATNFMECVAEGNPVMESYPRQCRSGDNTYVENIGNELEKINLIRLDAPHPNQSISSPLIIKGEARGTWFFEGDFPIILTNWDGLIIAEGIARTEDEWMTEDFVPFEAILEFEKPTYGDNGNLILRKDNPSGLPEYDDALEIPIFFK
jgi:hypothetical protein